MNFYIVGTHNVVFNEKTDKNVGDIQNNAVNN